MIFGGNIPQISPELTIYCGYDMLSKTTAVVLTVQKDFVFSVIFIPEKVLLCHLVPEGIPVLVCLFI